LTGSRSFRTFDTGQPVDETFLLIIGIIIVYQSIGAFMLY
jgi:hypothetical protein